MPKASLTKINFSEVDLNKADLSEVDLSKADLQGADLEETNLQGANLQGANLQRARLIRTDLSQATITGAYLYGTARDDWTIDGILCDYIYWDVLGQQRTPENRNFRPGEFEELYKQLPTFEYYFEQGFTASDIVSMNRMADVINQQNPEFDLKLVSFDSRGQPHAKFTVLHKENVESARKQIKEDYEARLKVLEGQKDVLMELFSKTLSGGFHIERVDGELTMGNKQIGRDNINITGHAQVGSLITGASYHGLTPENPEQLKTRATLQQRYQALNTQVGDLRSAYIAETDPATRLHLKQQIEAAEAELTEIGQQLEVLDHQQTITRAMIDLIQSLPNLHDGDSQRAFLASAGIDPAAHDQIPTGKPPARFAPLLVSTCAKYGRLADGRHALAAVLETAKQYIGLEKQAQCDELIQQIQTYF